MGAFKTTSSKSIRRAGLPEFQWQKSFYDHIIRNDADLARVREYIHNNPLKWAEDEENVNAPGLPASGQTGGQRKGVILSDKQKKILEILKKKPQISRKELAEELNINTSAIQKPLLKL